MAGPQTGHPPTSLRILMATDFYPPFIGGVERQAEVVSHELHRAGHEVIVATVWRSGLPREEDQSGVKVRRLRGLMTSMPWFSTVAGRRFHPPFPDPAIVLGLRRLIRRRRPDLVHARGWIAYSCAVATLGTRVPLLISAHDYGYACPVRTLMRRGEICDGPAFLKCVACAHDRYGVPKALAAVVGVLGGRALLRRRVTTVHGISDFVADFHRQYLLGGKPREGRPGVIMIPDVVATVPPGISHPRATASEHPSLAGLPDQPYILFVGGLTANKGIGPLLQAYNLLPSPPPLVLIGTTWPDTPSTFAEGVTVLRDVPHDAVMQAWEHCLFGVVPSTWAEPLGDVAVEAMASGKAVIASRVGGLAGIVVHSQSGLLVPPGDVAALAEAMRRLLEDPDLRHSLGRGGRARAELFGADIIMPQFEELYRDLVTRTRAR